jgi:hypothetical protein
MTVELRGRGIAILCVAIVAYIFSTITVVLRCFVRLRIVRFFGWDDALMVLALVRDPLTPKNINCRMVELTTSYVDV